jgi:retinol dehydrogenase-14
MDLQEASGAGAVMGKAAMAGRACLVTGATSGIGKSTAAALASRGARVGIVARDQAKGEAAVADLTASSGNGQIDLFVGDLSSQTQVRALDADVCARWERLHVLVNCAGAFYRDRHETVDGLELTFALNHLAYFLLTTSLLDILVASAPSRIINVTSGAQSVGRIDLDDLQKQRRSGGRRPTTSPS